MVLGILGPLAYGLPFAFVLPGGRALHDALSGTQVVRSRR